MPLIFSLIIGKMFLLKLKGNNYKKIIIYLSILHIFTVIANIFACISLNSILLINNISMFIGILLMYFYKF